MRISVALAAFNGSKYLLEQLESLENQSIFIDELIFCDDASTDSTLDIVKSWATKSKINVAIFKNEKNLGYTANFYRALSLCNGDIVFICDQDDVWLPNKLKTVLQKHESDKEAKVVIHDLDYCDKNLERIGQRKLQRVIDVLRMPVESGYVTGMATSISCAFLSLVLDGDEKNVFSYDRWIHEIAYRLGLKRIVPESLALYRRHGEASTSDSIINYNNKLTKFVFFLSRLRNKNTFDINRKINQLIKINQFLLRNKIQIVTDLGVTSENYNYALEMVQSELSFFAKRKEIIASSLINSIRIYAESFIFTSNLKKHKYNILSVIKDIVTLKG